MVAVLSWQGAAAIAGVIRRDEVFISPQKGEQVAVVFQNALPPGTQGEAVSRGWSGD